MAYEEFTPKAFNPKHRAIIDRADAIMRKYAAQDYDLSLRQLYYQFVAHEGLPNTEQNYKLLGNVISDARLAGELDWDLLVDRGRETVQNPHWESPADIVDSAAQSYRIDLWEDQPNHVEVMVEKQALEGVLLPVCRRFDVPFTANKGYSSSSAMYSAGKRIEQKIADDKNPVVIYLGDHDPSGIDMSRDVLERLELFSYGDIELSRIALNMDQVISYNPPPNPAKLTDSRAGAYVKRFGRESWELDALDPETLANLVSAEIERHLDRDLFDARIAKQTAERETLIEMAKDYRESQQ